MLKNKNLIEVRNNLEPYLKKLQAKGSLPSSSEIATSFVKEHTTIIDLAAPDLIILALTKLVAEVGARKSHRPWTDAQSELFGRIKGIPNTIEIATTTKNRQQKSKLLTPLATRSQLIAWLESETKKRVSRKSRHSQLNDLLKSLKPYFTAENTTLEEAMIAARLDGKSLAA